MMRKVRRKLAGGSVFALIMALILMAIGCGRNAQSGRIQTTADGASELVSFESAVNLIDDEGEPQLSQGDIASEDISEPSAAEPSTTEAATTETATTEAATIETITSETTTNTALPEDGTYSSKDEVALYLHTYGTLPSNFITKKEAKKLGWTGGSVEDYAPGKAIGGDYFGNYEGLLPEDKEYHECDIDTLGKSSRGAKRIIYSDDGYIYYTDDHYESFELLYEP
ncbi:ribonuclease [Butyrivibrio sp. DSM 10294]|uniref:ribonuclease domain-containing protein n=1 Tax=Butyrivibrio sp. DSM 10294 TaxID=2972457 RepID=UPI00234EE0D8|nr:ribonuclease domain-containing protein [Butyrivibrio sp. DSM 10294]MDC7293619.1 ribonuclease [Butyrivibrio sp. DSM 10294]